MRAQPLLLSLFLVLLLLPSPAASLVSDDFFLAGIDSSRWEQVDPLSDATIEVAGAGSADARLQISVPAGQEHDLWTDGLNAPRLRQPCGTADFTVEVKFESAVKSKYQTQGVLAEGPEGALRFEFLGDGAGTRVYAAEIRPGIDSTTKLSRTITGGAPLYMRVTRAGSRWAQSYSSDGQSWLAGASFTTALQLSTIAVYGGNAGAPAPAHTALIDYVFDLQSPLIPEDGGDSGPDLQPPAILEVTATPGTTSAQIAWRSDETAEGEVEYGTAESGTLGTIAAPTAAISQTVELSGLESDRDYWFRIRAWDAAGNQAISELQTFRTLLPVPCRINFWYGPSQIFGSPGIAQQWVNILGDVAVCPDLATLSYRLNDGAERLLSVGPDGRRLAGAGDFNADIAVSSLRPGSNRVEVIARNSYGEATSAEVQVDWRAELWPLPYQIDWQSISQVPAAVQVVDGQWRIDQGLLYPQLLAYDRLVALGGIHWRDYEVTVPITVAAVDPAGFNGISTAPGIGVQLRWNGHTDYPYSYSKQPLFGWLPVGATAWYGFGSEKFKLLLNGRLVAEDTSGRQATIGSTWIFKLRGETLPTGEPWYRFKFWPASQSEPAQWDLEGVGYPTDPVAGSVLLVAHHVDARFGNVTVVPLDAPPPTYTLTTTVDGAGRVTRTPDQATYAANETVTLTASADSGWLFAGWSGDWQGEANPISVTMGENLAVVAHFVADTTPPVIGEIQVTAGATEAVVSWSSDEPTRPWIAYGPSEGEMAVGDDASLATAHTFHLSALQADTLYDLQVGGYDAADNLGLSDLRTFRTAAAAPVPYLLTTTISGQGLLTRSPDQATYLAGDTVTLTATAAPGWQFEGWSGDLEGETNPGDLLIARNSSVTARFTQLSGGPGLPLPDEFDGTAIDPALWRFLDPLGDATVSVDGGRGAITIPAGVEHDLWSMGNFAPRLVQSVADGDFDLMVKFDSALIAKYQMQGLVIEGEEGFLRIELLGDGRSTRLFTASVIGGTAVTIQNKKISNVAPLYLRLQRIGDTWTPFWSADGVRWTAGTPFSQRLTVATVGVYGGNAGGNPAHTVQIDWFRPAP